MSIWLFGHLMNIFRISLAVQSEKAGYRENLPLQPANVLQKSLEHLRVSAHKNNPYLFWPFLCSRSMQWILPIFILCSVNYDWNCCWSEWKTAIFLAIFTGLSTTLLLVVVVNFYHSRPSDSTLIANEILNIFHRRPNSQVNIENQPPRQCRFRY